MKVGEFHDKMATHADVAVGTHINQVLSSLIQKGQLVDGDELTCEKLGLIKRELDEAPMAPELIFMTMLPGASQNPVESALQLIEQMMRE